jgi:S-DNA-T family DNA segregation ATPase FtsK/SpoIIIE
LPITAVILDEVQVFLENPTRQLVGGIKTTLGAHIADLLTYLAKKGPAAGIVVILATQRPDSTTIPSRLRAVLGSRFALRVMDWRDSNIILGEQMNTRGYDSSTLLPGHKGVGILRPDGDTQGGTDVLALTVRTHYMPNTQWREVCARGRELRRAAGTLTGHAAGDHSARAVDSGAVLKALGSGSPDEPAPELPEPLASVVGYLGDELDRREFVPTAELVEVLEVEPTAFGRQMSELGCQPTRRRVEHEEGGVRQVRGYRTAEIRTAIQDWRGG